MQGKITGKNYKCCICGEGFTDYNNPSSKNFLLSHENCCCTEFICKECFESYNHECVGCGMIMCSSCFDSYQNTCFDCGSDICDDCRSHSFKIAGDIRGVYCPECYDNQVRNYRTENDIIEFFKNDQDSLVDFIIKSDNCYVIKAYAEKNNLVELLKAIFEKKHHVDFEWLYFLVRQYISIDIEAFIEFRERMDGIYKEDFHWREKLYINKIKIRNSIT